MGLFRSLPAQSKDLPPSLLEEDPDGEEMDTMESAGKPPFPRAGVGRDTVLGQGQIFEGTLSGEGAVRLDGTFKGDIKLQGSVVVSVSGSLVGTIEASSVFVSGSVKGDIITHGKTRLAYGCKVKGDIQSESLAIEEGASFDGRNTMLMPNESGCASKSLEASAPPLEALQFGRNYTPEHDGDPSEDAQEAATV